MKWMMIAATVALLGCNQGEDSQVKNDDESFYCHKHCSFIDGVSHRWQKQEYDVLESYLVQESDQRVLDKYGFYVKTDDKPNSLAERKAILYDAIVTVVGDDQEKIALMMIMAMAETFEMYGWDTIKDQAQDGSRNFTIFNMNEDYLNSIRHDLNHLPAAMEKGLSDPIDGYFRWAQFNEEGGWNYLDEQIYLLNASIELWGITNVLTIHRYGYNGVEGKAHADLNLIYVHGVREGVNFLLENPEYYQPEGSMLEHRVAGTIPHI